jgi:hypothetical protein
MNFLKTCLAVLLGVVLEAAIYHPRTVHAVDGVTVKEVKEGYNGYLTGSQIVGFACKPDACYIATK